jgi:uncharacterized Zn-binding protein involved in type VI secretion
MEKGIARKFIDVVGPGGVLIDPPPNGLPTDFCFTEGMPIAIFGQLVAPHPPCGIPGGTAHCTAVMISSSLCVFINGIGVVRLGDGASCGDFVNTSSVITFSD